MYTLISTNLTSVGGPMGSERTTRNYQHYFYKKKNAKSFTQKSYEDEMGEEEDNEKILPIKRYET